MCVLMVRRMWLDEQQPQLQPHSGRWCIPRAHLAFLVTTGWAGQRVPS